MPYSPHPKQREFHQSPAKVKWLQAGRRGGKTRAALQEVLKGIDELSREWVKLPGQQPQSAEDAQLIPSIHVWTVAPTKAQMYQVWNEMQAFIPPQLVARANPYSQGTRGGVRGSGFKENALHVWLEFKDRSGKHLRNRPRPIVFWELRSADNPESLQSAGLDFLHVTEAQDIDERAWNKMSPMLLSAGRAGRGLVEGIPPYGRSHWFARNFAAAQRSPNSRREAFQWTFADNPLISAEQLQEVNEAKETMMEEDWNRLYMAIQPEGAGAFFQKITDAATAKELSRPEEGAVYVAGLDLGRSNDATVLIIKNRRTRASVHVVELRKTDWVAQKETIIAAARYWGLKQIVMDSTGLGGQFARDEMYMELAHEGINLTPFNFTPLSKYHDLFLPYRLSLEQQTVTFPKWPRLIEQLEDIEHRQTSNRGHVFSSISGGHDDWVDAEVMALFACDPAPSQLGGVKPARSIPGLRGQNSGPRTSRRTRKLLVSARESRHVLTEDPPDLIVNGEPVNL